MIRELGKATCCHVMVSRARVSRVVMVTATRVVAVCGRLVTAELCSDPAERRAQREISMSLRAVNTPLCTASGDPGSGQTDALGTP